MSSGSMSFYVETNSHLFSCHKFHIETELFHHEFLCIEQAHFSSRKPHKQQKYEELNCKITDSN